MKNIERDILSYAKRLSPLKQMEALNFIKWLWGGVGAEPEFTEEQIKKIKQLGKKNGGKKFDSWKEAKKYLENLMK